jgi:RimJ/RimL family protein N-acetyltransferase
MRRSDQPAPILTQRLLVAPPSHFRLEGHHYLDDLYAIYSDPDVRTYFGMSERSRADVVEMIDEENESWRNDDRGLLLMHEPTLDRIVGIIKVQTSPLESPRDAEVVYATHPDFRRRGFVSEAVAAVIKQEFAEGRTQLIARISPTNVASRVLLEMFGFRRGVDRKPWADDEPVEHVYELAKA